MYRYLKYSEKERIAEIRLNRPEKRNALNGEFVEELIEVFRKAEASADAKIVRLTAEGDAFCAGADLAYLQQLQNNSFEENLADSRKLMSLYRTIYTLDQIVVAQIEGHAIAGGAGLAAVCDFAFSVPEAKYGYTEVAIGFVPAIVSIFLIRKIGETKAKELLLSGRLISAKQALEYGILNGVYPEIEIADAVDEFVQNITRKASADSLRLTKKLIADVQSLPVSDALEYASRLNAEARGTADCQRGITGFLNKERITW